MCNLFDVDCTRSFMFDGRHHAACMLRRRWVMSILQYSLASKMLSLPAVAPALGVQQYSRVEEADHVSHAISSHEGSLNYDTV